MSKKWQNILNGLFVFFMGMIGGGLLLFKFGFTNQFANFGLIIATGFMIIGFLVSLFAIVFGNSEK